MSNVESFWHLPRPNIHEKPGMSICGPQFSMCGPLTTEKMSYNTAVCRILPKIQDTFFLSIKNSRLEYRAQFLRKNSLRLNKYFVLFHTQTVVIDYRLTNPDPFLVDSCDNYGPYLPHKRDFSVLKTKKSTHCGFLEASLPSTGHNFFKSEFPIILETNPALLST